jgi:splicing factor 3B subunit 1
MLRIIDRMLVILGPRVRPYLSRVLLVLMPMLIDDDYYTRVEGRSLITNLSKAAGYPYMLSTLRPDVDSSDDYVRNITAKTVTIVAQAYGISAMVPFLTALARSPRSWQARHSSMKIICNIAIAFGGACLEHLDSLVNISTYCINDDILKNRVFSALAISSLADSVAPFGIDSFENTIRLL